MSETNLLADYLDLEPFPAEVNRDPRTVRRWMNAADGLPFTRLGSRILIHIPSARQWLLSRMRHPNPRRSPTESARPLQEAKARKRAASHGSGKAAAK